MYSGWMTAMPTPRFEPTEQQRQNVEILVACGTPYEAVAQIVRHPDGRSISERTLRKYFRPQLDAGRARLKLRMARLFVATVEGNDDLLPPGVRPITDEFVRGRLLELYVKCRMGWSTRRVTEIANAEGKPFVYKASPADAQRRGKRHGRDHPTGRDGADRTGAHQPLRRACRQRPGLQSIDSRPSPTPWPAAESRR
jgi:hypothetical protein